MFQDEGADGEGGVSIRLVSHLYKEQRIIIDLFMDRQNRWRPMEMRQAGRLYISARILAIVVEGFTKTSGEPTRAAASDGAAAAQLLFVPSTRSVITLKTA